MGYINNLQNFLHQPTIDKNNMSLNMQKAKTFLEQTVIPTFDQYRINSQNVYSVGITPDIKNLSVTLSITFVNLSFTFAYKVSFDSSNYYKSPKFFTGYSFSNSIQLNEVQALNNNDRLTENGIGQDILDYLTLSIANTNVSSTLDTSMSIRDNLNVYSKQYIDDTYYDKAFINDTFITKLNAYTKQNIDDNYHTKTYIDTNYYTKTNIDNIDIVTANDMKLGIDRKVFAIGQNIIAKSTLYAFCGLLGYDTTNANCNVVPVVDNTSIRLIDISTNSLFNNVGSFTIYYLYYMNY